MGNRYLLVAAAWVCLVSLGCGGGGGDIDAAPDPQPDASAVDAGDPDASDLVDECTEATDDCVDAANGGTCTDTDDGFTCGCQSGYAGDGTVGGTGCTDIDECASGTDTCVDTVAGGTCTDTDGGFTCGCLGGYSGDGSTTGSGCTDIDECATSMDNCVEDADGGVCTDIDGSFTCGCQSGYDGDGLAAGTGCADIDECAAAADACGYAACTNTVGDFRCSVMYGVSPFQDWGWVLHPTTLQVIGAYEPALTGSTVTGMVALATDPTTGIHYGLAKLTGVSGRVLVTVDFQPGTAVLTQVGPTGGNFTTLAFREDGQLFGVTGQNATATTTIETLYTIDKATAAITLATTLGNGADGEVIAYNPDDDFFYHWSGNGSVVFERIASTAPYTVTNIPITGTTNGETFGAMYLGGGQFLISNINSSFNVVTTTGTWGTASGSNPDDLRGLTVEDVSPDAFRASPNPVSTAGGATVTVSGSFGSDASTVRLDGTAIASPTITANQITFVAPAMAAGAYGLEVEGATSGLNRLGTLTYADPPPRLVGDEPAGAGSPDGVDDGDDVGTGGCGAGGDAGPLAGLLALALLVFARRFALSSVDGSSCVRRRRDLPARRLR